MDKKYCVQTNKTELEKKIKIIKEIKIRFMYFFFLLLQKDNFKENKKKYQNDYL